VVKLKDVGWVGHVARRREAIKCIEKKCSYAAGRGCVGFLESQKIVTGCNVETRNAWKKVNVYLPSLMIPDHVYVLG
jgi:hypothetical protein